ncbi:MAG TPA: hypothetical protein PLX89_08945, partial [Verrucomicrobiota bacterium]|nr:hypothetical protein [Verrucomicrobiota bacterium]
NPYQFSMHAGQPRLQVSQSLFVRASLLTILLQLMRVMVEKKRPVVGLDLFDAGILRQPDLILNELQMHGRSDGPGSVILRWRLHEWRPVDEPNWLI